MMVNIQEYFKTGIFILKAFTKKSVGKSLFHNARWWFSMGRNTSCHSSLIILKGNSTNKI